MPETLQNKIGDSVVSLKLGLKQQVVKGIFVRTAFLLGCMAISLVTATAMAGPPGLAFLPPGQVAFDSYSQLFTWIAAERNLGDPFDESLVRQIQADSSVDHVHDRSSDPIAIVRVELLNGAGTSRAGSEDGNYPFYVLRETQKGLVLMGRMFGRTYRSSIRGRNLEFHVELHRSADKVVQMRFRVEDNTLLNLSAPPRRSGDGLFARLGTSTAKLSSTQRERHTL